MEHRSALSLVHPDLIDVQPAQEVHSTVGMFVEPGLQSVSFPVEQKADTSVRSRDGALQDGGIQAAGQFQPDSNPRGVIVGARFVRCGATSQRRAS